MALEEDQATGGASAVIRRIASDQIANYERQPRELISHHNREVSALDGYRGRQILELLQNADDAGADLDDGSRVLFVLDRKRLVVANTGTPFSHEGIMSLVISDCSPKQLEQNRFIGCKGLGFRAVLTWTTRPLILSGEWCVRFDQAHALSTVKQFTADNPSIADPIHRYRKATNRWPAPVMRFPQCPDPKDEDLVLAKRLQAEGYDTILILPFEDGDGGSRDYSDAESQLRELPTTSMLFCRHLTEVSIQGSLDRRWSILREPVDEERHKVLVDDGNGDLYWEVSRRLGAISEEASGDMSGGGREFETAVAVPGLWNYESDGNCLCVFFPTRERLPCPAILHATLETTENRNRLVDNAGNREVLQALASHFVDVVEAQVAEDDRLRALQMMNGVENVDPELQSLGFLEAVVDACGTRSIFPRIDGSFAPASGVRKPPQDVWRRVLDPEHFPEILSAPSKAGMSALLELFEIGWFEPGELKESLSHQLCEMDPVEAGRVVGRLLNSNQLLSIGVGGLLMDQTEAIVDEAQRCLSTPAEVLPELPTWAREVHFLHPSFQNGMLETAGASSVRALVVSLDRNKGLVSEYRFETVARAVIGKIKTGDDVADSSVKEKWRNLFPWLLSASRNSRQALDQLPISVITTNGDLKRAGDCYLSNDYAQGELVWNLYKPVRETNFVTTPDQLGLAGFEDSEVEEFLLKLGVRSSPKLVDITKQTDAKYQLFLEYVLDTLKYPVSVRGKRCESPEDVRQLCHRYQIAGLTAPEHFVRLLEEGNPEAVAAYLLSSGSGHLQSDQAGGATFMATIETERVLRPDEALPIPNLILHWLQNHAWIPGADGKNHRPSEVMLSGAGLRVLKGVYSEHVINPKEPCLARRGGRSALNSLLMRLGAVASLEALGSEQVYELLLGLPKRDPEGGLASSIYRTFLDANVSIDEGPARSRFMREGLVWAKHRGMGSYVSYREVRYNATVSVPKVVEDQIELLSLPRRKSAKIVEMLLGVKPLSANDIQVSVVSEMSEYDSSSEDANAFLRRCIPFVYALRLGKNVDAGLRECSLLKEIHLFVCRRLTVDVVISRTAEERLVLGEPGDRIAIGSNLYLIGEYDPGSSSAVRFSLAVAGLVAELLGTDVAADVGAVLRCRSEQEMKDVIEELLGSEAKVKMAEAYHRLEDTFVDVEDVTPTRLPDVVETGTPGAERDEQGDSGSKIDPPAEEEINPIVPDGEIDGTKFEETVGPERGKRRRLKVVVRKTGGGGGGTGGGKTGPFATEAVTFRIVKAFERQAGSGRHVVDVSHFQGADALGCDLISVGTEALKDKIQESRIVNDRDVERYIEVKGRSSKTGEVELTDNEYRAAAKHRDRYYIYRVFVDPDDPSGFEVAVLADPTNSAAVRTVTRFDFAEGLGAVWYQAKEVVEE